MTSLLETIQSGRQSKPPRVLLYGVEGIGKSTFGSEAPKPVFIQTEDGLDEIECNRFPLATKFDEVMATLKTLVNEKHDFESVVIDSLDWLERLVWDKLCQQYGVESIEKVDGGYARGYMHALSLWREVLDLLNVLRSRGMVVVLIAHSKVERFEDPESSPYDRAEAWWSERCLDPCPEDADEAMDIAEAGLLASPSSITVRSVSGQKYDRILKQTLGEIPNVPLEEAPF
jgi:hypothetical protein